MIWTPHATVATIIEMDQKFLMVEEKDGDKIVINQPAGHIEENESISEAALRETLEETRWHVKLSYFVGVYTYCAPNGITYYRFCFAADPVKEEPGLALDKGIIAAHWLSLDAIRQQPDLWRSPLVSRCLEDYLRGQRMPLSIIYEHQG